MVLEHCALCEKPLKGPEWKICEEHYQDWDKDPQGVGNRVGRALEGKQ